MIKKLVEKAIVETLVVENKQSIHIAVNKIFDILNKERELIEIKYAIYKKYFEAHNP